MNGRPGPGARRAGNRGEARLMMNELITQSGKAVDAEILGDDTERVVGRFGDVTVSIRRTAPGQFWNITIHGDVSPFLSRRQSVSPTCSCVPTGTPASNGSMRTASPGSELQAPSEGPGNAGTGKSG